MADLKPGFEQDGYRFNGGDPASPQSWHPIGMPIGTIDSGYKFLGGDPSQQTNWEKAPERSYIGAAAESGIRTLGAAVARTVEDINPFTTSDAELATLFKDDPEQLKKFQEQSAVSVLSRFANEQTKRAREVMRQVNPSETGAISGKPLSELEYATTDPEKAAYLSPTRIAGDVLQSVPTSLALMVSAYFTRGRSLAAAQEAEAAALASGASAEAAKAAAKEAAIKTGAETMAKVGAASEGTAGYAVQKNQSIDEVMGMDQQKLEQSPAYLDLIQQGYDPKAARVLLANQVGTDAGIAAGAVDAATNLVGGHFLGKVIGEGGKLGARVAKGVANESATEFVQSAGEQAGANLAARRVDPNRPLGEGVLESAIAGGVVGGVTGGATAGMFGSNQRDVQHDQALATIAGAPNAEQAIAGAGELAGNLDNIVRQDLTPATDALLGVPASETPAQARPAAPETVDQAIAGAQRTAEGGLLSAQLEMPRTAEGGLLPAQLEVQRQLDEQSGIPTAERTAEELPTVGAPTLQEPGAPLALPEMQANMDRRAELLGQAANAGFEAERNNALAQEQTVAESLPAGRQRSDFVDLTPMNQMQARQRLAVLRAENPDAIFAATAHPSAQGKFAIRTLQAPTAQPNVAAPAPMTAAEQNKLESAAMVGEQQNRRAEDSPRQRMISRAMANIESRGGVASPMEAEILREANMGQPFDRVDPALGRQASADQKLTAATGIAVGQEAGLGFGARESTSIPNTEPFAYSPELQGQKRAEPVPAEAPQTDVQQYIQGLRQENTPRARALVANYEAGRLTDADVQASMRAENPAAFAPTADERLAAAAEQGRLNQTSPNAIIQSDAKFSSQREPVVGSTETVNDGGAEHQLTFVDGGSVAGMNGLVRQLARTFGKRVAFFTSDTLKADGFVRNGDNRTIYLNANSQMSPLAVFGHELMHLIKRDNPLAYRAVAAVIARRMDAEARAKFRADYGTGANLEELSSDLLGNAFSDEQFLRDVFDEIALNAPTEQARSVIGRFAAAVNKAVKAAIAVVKASGQQQGFKADEIVKNLEDIRLAMKAALMAYAGQQIEVARQLEAEQMRAEAKIKLEDNAGLTQGTSTPADVSGANATTAAESPVPAVPKAVSRFERTKAAAKAARQQMGETITASRVRPDSWKADAAEESKAAVYEERTGEKPYLSAGQIKVPLEGDGTKFSVKRPYTEKDLANGKLGNDPLTGLPLNKNGTVTLYFPTTNAVARELSRTKQLKGVSPEANRIYLTNESSGPKVMSIPGNIDHQMDGANVLLQVDPRLLHLDQEHTGGRKDFFIPIAEGQAFRSKMTKLFTLDAPRTRALTKDTKLTDLQERISAAVSQYMQLDGAGRRARLKQARAVLKEEHNVGTLLGVNGKLEKTNLGGYGINNYNGKDVMSMGLGLASAQKINEKNLSTCPKSAICEGLCLGETSGQNLLYGGEGQFKSGPRLAQYLKTEAMVQHPEDFAIVLHNEIERFQRAAAKEDYQPTVRLNVTSDFRPQTFEGIINAFPGVMFYDYTKLPTDLIAANHHLTYSSTGASQIVDGKTVVNPESNWDKLVEDRLMKGENVAMAFTSRTDMPSYILDERTGERFQVWNGDNYDARFLDPKPGQPGNELNRGMIVGLTNKDKTTAPEQAAVKHKGFFLDYAAARDGDTLVIRDQKKLAAGEVREQPVRITRRSAETEQRAQPVVLSRQRAAEEIPRDELAGRSVKIAVRVQDTGETATLTMDAKDALNDIDERESVMNRLLECLAK